MTLLDWNATIQYVTVPVTAHRHEFTIFSDFNFCVMDVMGKSHLQIIV